MATIDLTVQADKISHGLRTAVKKYGALEEVSIILDEDALVAKNGAVAAGDVIQVYTLSKGDIVLGGFGEVLVAGATANATLDFDFSGGTANGIVAALNADGAAGTFGAVNTGPEAVTANDTLDITVNTAGMTTSTHGRWMFVAYLFRGSRARARNTYAQYTGDPNVPPQA